MKKLLAIIFTLLIFLPGMAERRIAISLDSVTMMMGNMNVLNVEIVINKGEKGTLPILNRASKEGLIHLLNDTIELRGAAKVDTLQLGSGFIQLNYKFPMQCFFPGTYLIPPIEYINGGDTLLSNSPVLKVTAPQVTANDSISPDTPPVGPYYNSGIEKITDKIPDVIYYYWWIILLAILALAGGVWLWKKRNLKNPLNIIRRKPELPPYEKAIAELKKLRDSKLWEHGEEKQYYIQLTNILRKYLYGRFGINALEMTTRQIAGAIKKNEEAWANKDSLNEVLNMADYVKFAKMRPLPDDNIAAFQNTLQFVEKTKPQPESEKETTAEKIEKGAKK